MPANVVRIENTAKHLTKAERAARESAQNQNVRKLVRLIEPQKVKEDEVAHEYWKKTVKLLRGIDLLDNVDADMLGWYCVMSSRLEMLTDIMRREAEAECGPSKAILSRIEVAERNLMSYADKLGLTPTGRARLAVKKAKVTEDPDADIYGD